MRINGKVARGEQKITAHGGTLLLRKLEEGLNLKQILDTLVYDKRPRRCSPSGFMGDV